MGGTIDINTGNAIYIYFEQCYTAADIGVIWIMGEERES